LLNFVRKLTKSDNFLYSINKYFFREWSEVAPISIGRILPGVALLDGKVYVIGGELESCIIANCECYDPRDNVWTPIACMEEPRCDFGLCALDNSLYAFGGWVGEDIGGSIEIYDPISNTWTLEGYLPEPRFSMGVVAYEGNNSKSKSNNIIINYDSYMTVKFINIFSFI